ncbi:MAG: tyrosine-type recombinase/integrase [Proteobacteria bacterium]|nr:tyrosine-type recombinase/integrase [Pseudomonadota bacterium]
MTEVFIKPLFLSNDSTDFRLLTQALSLTPGYNLNDGPNMLKASNDAQALQSFLVGYQGSPLTYQTYLKELERLVLWCTHIQKTTISALSFDDLVAYQRFLANPQPSQQWCGNKRSKCQKDGQVNPQWRPFSGGLSVMSIKKTMSILDSFFNYLVQTQYLKGNPLSVAKRRKKRSQAQSMERWLEKTEINTVLEALTYQLESKSLSEFQVIRAKYIILTLFYTGLRLAELTNHTMGNFVLIEGEWFLKVVGKGEKMRKIVVVDDYLDALIEFRKSLGFESLHPAFEESTPLICAQDKKTPIHRRRVDQILKQAFEIGAIYYETAAIQNKEDSHKLLHRASKLRKASAHWLRHSYGTYLVKSGCPIEKVKTLMGHSDISTTMIYVHIATQDLHGSAQGLTLKEETQ